MSERRIEISPRPMVMSDGLRGVSFFFGTHTSYDAAVAMLLRGLSDAVPTTLDEVL